MIFLPNFNQHTFGGLRMSHKYSTNNLPSSSKSRALFDRCRSGTRVQTSEIHAWKWLFSNGKLGVGDFVREGRWEDAALYLNFVTWSYNNLVQLRNRANLPNKAIPLWKNPTARNKQTLIELMVTCQLALYHRISSNEFHSLPIDECQNPLAAAGRIVCAANGTPSNCKYQTTTLGIGGQEAWSLLESLLNKLIEAGTCTKNLRDWAFRMTSLEKQEFLKCVANFGGRIRRHFVPVIIVVFYAALKTALRQSEEPAWSYIQGIVSRMTTALRTQLCSYIVSYRRLGFFQSNKPSPTSSCLNDGYLKVCLDLLNNFPQFLWHELYVSFSKIYNPRNKHRKAQSVVPRLAVRNASMSNERIFDDRGFCGELSHFAVTV